MSKIIWNTDVNAPCCPGEIVNEDGRTLLIQTDWDYPAVARNFGWDMSEVKPAKRTWYGERGFSIELPADAIADCSHQGDCSADVELWAQEIERPESCTADALRKELEEYGAWDGEQLADDAANWERMVWCAACSLKEEVCTHDSTDGTIDCDCCGCTASEFISAAQEWLESNDGATADDPGYFE